MFSILFESGSAMDSHSCKRKLENPEYAQENKLQALSESETMMFLSIPDFGIFFSDGSFSFITTEMLAKILKP